MPNYKKEDATDLTQFYDNLKSQVSDIPTGNPGPQPMNRFSGHPMGATPHMIMHSLAAKSCDKLKDDCCKHIILDIYCKIIPFDQEYIDGNMGQMKQDVDAMLNNKNVTATQYLTSAFESTHAPLLDYILRSCDAIRDAYMEDAEKKIKDAEGNNIDIPTPEAPSVDDEEVQNQLIDVVKDMEYESFMNQLKEKTTNQIVGGVADILNTKKEESDMIFKPKTESMNESATSVALDYLSKMLIKEGVELKPGQQDEVIGLAIREATFNQMDTVFNLPGHKLKDFSSNIRFGKGVIINESVSSYFKEDATQRFEPLYKETNGEKYDVANYEKVDKDGKKTPMTDQEAKQVLDAEGYKKFRNRGTSGNNN